MRIFLVTDMEGVAGVLDFDNWCLPSGRYYDVGRRFLTAETNAVADGFYAAGATEIHVLDAHGEGGLDLDLLDPRVEYARGWPCGFPSNLTRDFAFVAHVGQHAKSRTPFAHIPHTQDFPILAETVNGVEYGEFGEMALCAGELGIPVIFASGDQALAEEARALVPGIAAVAVKRGVTPGTGDECPAEAYARRNLSAVHMPPKRACELLRETAREALENAAKRPPAPVRIPPPYTAAHTFRPEALQPRRTVTREHPSSIAAVLNLLFDIAPPR